MSGYSICCIDMHADDILISGMSGHPRRNGVNMTLAPQGSRLRGAQIMAGEARLSPRRTAAVLHMGRSRWSGAAWGLTGLPGMMQGYTGGTLSASAGDGRVRAPYASKQYSDGLLKLMLEVKKIFDPHGILNPGVKTASMEDVRTLLRGDYNLNHRHEHLPRS